MTVSTINTNSQVPNEQNTNQSTTHTQNQQATPTQNELQNNEASRNSHHGLQNLQNVNSIASTQEGDTYTLSDLQIAEQRQVANDNSFDYYRGLIEENGGTFLESSDQRNILGLRCETNTTENDNQGAYDDKMIMLWLDEDGKKQIRYYESTNTEPSARYEGKYGVDADGDGKKDLGRMPVGYQEYTVGKSAKFGDVLRPTSDTHAERDTDHDGDFDDEEFASAGKSMIFHPGGNNMTGSAGCQTLPPDEYDTFWEDLTQDGSPSLVGYTLMNTNTLDENSD